MVFISNVTLKEIQQSDDATHTVLPGKKCTSSKAGKSDNSIRKFQGKKKKKEKKIIAHQPQTETLIRDNIYLRR